MYKYIGLALPQGVDAPSYDKFWIHPWSYVVLPEKFNSQRNCGYFCRVNNTKNSLVVLCLEVRSWVEYLM